MNSRIFVGIATGIIGIALALVVFAGPTLFSDVSEGGIFAPIDESQTEILPLKIELDKISILEVNERAATVEIKFKVTNSNFRSVILKMIKYELFENEIRVATGQIGERPEGMVAGSEYFTILTGSPTIVSDKITIRNSGNTPELWSALTNDNPNWRISGEAYSNLSSMTSGGESEIRFDFTN